MKVSVAMIAYNHEAFVEQALESALSQRFDADWEIVFGEDCSTDRTREIVQRTAAEHPGRIRLLLHEKNVGMMRNFAATIEACTGDYIALLEGDDFWTDPEKLQQQADLLDAHPDIATCFCRTRTVDETGATVAGRPSAKVARERYTLAHFLTGEFRPRTCSVMYRRGYFKRFPDWVYELPGGDFALHLLNGQHGDFAMIDREMVAYRVHAGGVWTQGINHADWKSAPEALQIRRLHARLDLQEMALRVLGRKYRDVVRPRFIANAFRLAARLWTNRDWPAMRRTLWRAIRANPRGTTFSPVWIAHALLVSHFPFLAGRVKK